MYLNPVVTVSHRRSPDPEAGILINDEDRAYLAYSALLRIT